MKHAWILGLLMAVGWSSAEAAPYKDDSVDDQWFTGSLLAPSPALPKAGIMAVEPYVVYQGNTGAFTGDWGNTSVSHPLNQVESLTVLKYSITDRLSIQALPSLSALWTDQTTSGGVKFGDLPIEVEYRFKDEDRKTGSPSVTVELGMSVPTGAYQYLQTPLAGVGSGAFTAKEGILLQSLFDTWGNHPMRVRLYLAAYEPLGSVSVRDTSSYGTTQGFQGYATPGISINTGVGIEYGLNQRWVLALDAAMNYNTGFSLIGSNADGSPMNVSSVSSTSFALAPAVEYNFNGSVGLIVGVQFSVAGQNTPSYIAPQIALAVAF